MARDILKTLKDEHDQIKSLFDKLNATTDRAVENTVMPDVHAAAVDTPEFAGRAKVFGEFVDHHAKEEEKTMFKMVRDLFTLEERAQLDEQYEAWKAPAAGRAAVAKAATQTGAAEIIAQHAS